MTVILAVDPGISGALAFYDLEPNMMNIYDMPLLDGDVDPHQLSLLVSSYRPTIAVIEKVHPMPREGVSGVWRFSAAYTTARVVVMLARIPLTLVSPAMWKNRMNLRGKKDGGAEQARNLAIMEFPNQAAHFSRKKDHGRAEACLLALYASRTLIHRNPSP